MLVHFDKDGTTTECADHPNYLKVGISHCKACRYCGGIKGLQVTCRKNERFQEYYMQAMGIK